MARDLCYHAATVKAVAHRAGLTSGAIYANFANQQELLGAAGTIDPDLSAEVTITAPSQQRSACELQAPVLALGLGSPHTVAGGLLL